MTFDPKTAVSGCRTLMLDMDGTILDLAFDTYVWKELVVGRYAEHNDLEYRVARDRLYAKYMAIQGDLEWYCLDHWSERLGFDVLELHREVHHRIVYLPGAQAFLETVRATDVRVLLVTNSHPDTLNLKNDRLGFGEYFDGIHSSHTYGHAKETQAFWHALREEEGFDPETTVFVDDTVPVLRSAVEFGIRQSVVITEPDTTEPVRDNGEFPGVAGVRELV
ncbi:MAG: HAD-IA family hydrolase [Woeseiaceae bacterium]|nr:HAD-IA family hydrolase [Woeseiaceae bacterium]